MIPLNIYDTHQRSLLFYITAFGIKQPVGRLLKSVKHWSLRTLRDKLIKIGAKVVNHSQHIIFQMAEVAVTERLFTLILSRIRSWRLAPA